MMEILELASQEPKTQQEYIQDFWNTWRLNFQNFTPQRHKRYVIEPSVIRSLWENGTIPLEDINSFSQNFQQQEYDKLDPRKALLINELLLVTNIYLKDRNLQVPTMIDEIVIPREFPDKPIKIVDYKTGKQFKEPTEKEKIQIFLMMTSVLSNIVDLAYSINYDFNDWDVTHNPKDIKFPFFTKRGLRKNIPGISGITTQDIIGVETAYTKLLTFSYINPLTQQEIIVDTNKLGISNTVGLGNILEYLNDINNFYFKYKKILKYRIDSKRSPYSLPSFPNRNKNKTDCAVQIAFNI